jgi:hypothetical protein
LTFGDGLGESSYTGGMLGLVVGLAAGKEFLTAARRLHVFHSNVESLLNITAIHNFKELYTDSTLGHVPYTARLAVVILVGHTL